MHIEGGKVEGNTNTKPNTIANIHGSKWIKTISGEC